MQNTFLTVRYADETYGRYVYEIGSVNDTFNPSVTPIWPPKWQVNSGASDGDYLAIPVTFREELSIVSDNITDDDIIYRGASGVETGPTYGNEELVYIGFSMAYPSSSGTSGSAGTSGSSGVSPRMSLGGFGEALPYYTFCYNEYPAGYSHTTGDESFHSHDPWAPGHWGIFANDIDNFCVFGTPVFDGSVGTESLTFEAHELRLHRYATTADSSSSEGDGDANRNPEGRDLVQVFGKNSNNEAEFLLEHGHVILDARSVDEEAFFTFEITRKFRPDLSHPDADWPPKWHESTTWNSSASYAVGDIVKASNNSMYPLSTHAVTETSSSIL